MRNQNNEYISRLQLDDFQVLLKEFDIELDQSTQQSILNMIKNNQYAKHQHLLSTCQESDSGS